MLILSVISCIHALNCSPRVTVQQSQWFNGSTNTSNTNTSVENIIWTDVNRTYMWNFNNFCVPSGQAGFLGGVSFCGLPVPSNSSSQMRMQAQSMYNVFCNIFLLPHLTLPSVTSSVTYSVYNGTSLLFTSSSSIDKLVDTIPGPGASCEGAVDHDYPLQNNSLPFTSNLTLLVSFSFVANLTRCQNLSSGVDLPLSDCSLETFTFNSQYQASIHTYEIVIEPTDHTLIQPSVSSGPYYVDFSGLKNVDMHLIIEGDLRVLILFTLLCFSSPPSLPSDVNLIHLLTFLLGNDQKLASSVAIGDSRKHNFSLTFEPNQTITLVRSPSGFVPLYFQPPPSPQLIGDGPYLNISIQYRSTAEYKRAWFWPVIGAILGALGLIAIGLIAFFVIRHHQRVVDERQPLLIH